MSRLKSILIEEIRANGPMPLKAYMHRALSDAQHGYYMQRRPFGQPGADGGDFITAPEVSQMFGELLGAWMADLWDRMGRPAPFCLAELGPGRGTLMADMLRATVALPEFAAAAQVHFVETSENLRAEQKKAVPQAVWHDTLDTLPPLPCLLVANEFFDALPISQYRKVEAQNAQDENWDEVMVSAEADGLCFTTRRAAASPFSDALQACLPDSLSDGDIVEACPDAEAAMHRLSRHLKSHSGAALIIDYGHAEAACGDSFQALAKHQSVDPLAAPGEADLTAHVNFPLLAHIAREGGLDCAPICQQGPFLEALGLNLRAQALMQASPGRENDINAERLRLAAPQHMGQLFKVLGVAHPDMPPLAGFVQ